jgi:mitogen-activated protein kinase kinase kinase 5
MFELDPPQWYVASTMGNIKLINKFRPQPTGFNNRLFEFWIDYLIECCRVGEEINDTRFPVLIQERAKLHTPSYVSIASTEGEVILRHVMNADWSPTVPQRPAPSTSDHNRPPQQWTFDSSSIKAVWESKRSERAVFFYQSTEDFMLVFPSLAHRHRFCQLIAEIASDDASKILSVEDMKPSEIEFEYDIDMDGVKVELGKGTYGVVYSGRDCSTQRQIAIKEIEIKIRTKSNR